MNKTILFTHSYFMKFDPKQWNAGQPYAPLGTLYAAALMRENNYTVSLFDTMFSSSADEVLPALKQTAPDFLVIYDDGFNYLTKMCLTNMREAAFRMIEFAKQHGCTVIVSSSDATDHYNEYIAKGADFVILGEAEITLLELCNALHTNMTVNAIHGIAYRQQGSNIVTAKRPVLKNLDELPLPAWDLVDIAPYRNMWVKHAGYFSMNVATTRGCPYKCNWCAKPIYGNRYNSRSPKHVVQELLMLKEKFHFDHIWFCDDIFGLKPGWVHEFALLTQEYALPLRFKIQSRADLLVQENYVHDLALAGCDNAWMGAESGSQKILDAMEKGTTINQIYEATSLLKQAGIKPSFFIQFGYPGEDHDDIDMTIRMINELLPHSIGISVSYPLPGTKFYEKVKGQLSGKSNWTDSDDLAMMFKNTYQPAFYKQLHRYVQKNYSRFKALDSIKRTTAGRKLFSVQMIRRIGAYVYYSAGALVLKRRLNRLQYEQPLHA